MLHHISVFEKGGLYCSLSISGLMGRWIPSILWTTNHGHGTTCSFQEPKFHMFLLMRASHGSEVYLPPFSLGLSILFFNAQIYINLSFQPPYPHLFISFIPLIAHAPMMNELLPWPKLWSQSSPFPSFLVPPTPHAMVLPFLILPFHQSHIGSRGV